MSQPWDAYEAKTTSTVRPPPRAPVLTKWENRRTRMRITPNIAHNAGVVFILDLHILGVPYQVSQKTHYVLEAEGVPPNITSYSWQKQREIMLTGEV